MDVRLLAYYLPQYHPIPENDAWWGKGFTEWRGVAAARAMFAGHYQPHIPADLGFYDLRVPETRRAQADLAREYGVHGFCYYHYWFDGRRLLERPMQEVLASGEPDFPFCVCWANENWTRRWDGRENDVLMNQTYSDGWEEAFIRDLLPALGDRRYIRVNGRPLILVYRVGDLPTPKASTEIWRRICVAEGVGDPYLVSVHSFDGNDPRPLGFDAAVDFPSRGYRLWQYDPRQVELLDKQFHGAIHPYSQLVDAALREPDKEYTWMRGVITGWDNSPRVGRAARIFAGNTPKEYFRYLKGLVDWTREHRVGDERLVFINAWNEWGEGAHLEPDIANGHRYLQATRDALLVSSS